MIKSSFPCTHESGSSLVNPGRRYLPYDRYISHEQGAK